jgi:endothelin-converting enzyme/putative endopeptidase
MRIETALARATLTRVERRDPYRVYHPMTRRQLAALVPSMRWEAYFAAMGVPPPRSLNVREPAFMLEVEARLQQEGLDAWRTYLRWQLGNARAPYLSRDFQRASFEFYSAFLNGVKEERPRWKKCVSWVDRDLGEALGEAYVARFFKPEVKDGVGDMVKRIQAAMAARLREIPWMAEPTRRAALEKLGTMKNKIGYPARWRDYRALRITRGDFSGNVARGLRFETARQLGKIGRPVDRDEWQMTPPTVNAYYDAQLNDMNFPAGVLQPPLYDPRLDAAPGYGNTGSTVAHELTHGFDDEGRQFDARGNLRDWWTAADAAEFQRRTACVADQYAQYTVVDDIKINSRLTLGEDVADLGGTRLAWTAWKDATRGKALEVRDALTPEQRFFVGFAQWACENATDEAKRAHAVVDPHSPTVWRVNGVVANLPEFREAFACRAGQPMARENRCEVW